MLSNGPVHKRTLKGMDACIESIDKRARLIIRLVLDLFLMAYLYLVFGVFVKLKKATNTETTMLSALFNIFFFYRVLFRCASISCIGYEGHSAGFFKAANYEIF